METGNVSVATELAGAVDNVITLNVCGWKWNDYGRDFKFMHKPGKKMYWSWLNGINTLTLWRVPLW